MKTSALAVRLDPDLLRTILAEYQLLIGEAVLAELRPVLLRRPWQGRLTSSSPGAKIFWRRLNAPQS